MTGLLVDVHSIFRWVVLLTAVAAIGVAVLSATGTRRWGVLGDRASLFFTLAMDIQFLIGVLVWVLERRWEGDVALGWLHPLAMLLAVALAHIGRSRADRDATSGEKGRQAAIFFSVSLLMILVAI
ncbi:MAG: hypothetical protein M3328_01910, partial [Chloroflexota bacterium]|nr:hypothetical protein [Chloroflexota bacterium]